MTRPSRRCGRRAHLAFALVAALGAVLAVATAAGADETANPLAGGESALHMKRGFLKELAGKGIDLSGDFTDGERILSLSVVGGALDPVDGKGLIEQDGILRLTHRRRAVVVARINADTTSGIMRARVAGAKMKLGFLARQSSERAGFGVNVRATTLKLSGKAARRLSGRLGLGHVAGLTPGRPISNLYSETQPRTVAVLPASSVPLQFDARQDTAIAKMFANGQLPLGIRPAQTHYHPVSPLTWGLITFPVATGSVAPDGSEGSLDLAGGFEIAMPSTGQSVHRSNITLDLAARTMASPDGSIGALDMSSSEFSPYPAERLILLQGVKISMSAPYAVQLNNAFRPFLPTPPPALEFQPGDGMGNMNLLLQAR